MALNLLALLMFVVCFLARSVEAPLSWSLALSAIGLLPLAMGGWLGCELVFVQGLGVEPQRSVGMRSRQGASRRSGGVSRELHEAFFDPLALRTLPRASIVR